MTGSDGAGYRAESAVNPCPLIIVSQVPGVLQHLLGEWPRRAIGKPPTQDPR